MSIEHIKIPLHSPEWYNFRITQGCGASEVPVIMGLSPYKSSLRLFYEKIGVHKSKDSSIRMHLGLYAENGISNIFNYWEKDNDTFLNNLNAGKKVRELEEVSAYVVNTKEMPYIFASLDRRYLDKDGKYVAVELKNTTQMAYGQHEVINPCHLVQIATQILCSGYKEGYLATLVDNSRFEVVKLTYKEALTMKSAIVNSVKEFWQGVLRARELQTRIYDARTNYRMAEVAQLEMELLQCEPEVDNDMAYLDYASELSKKKRESVPLKGNDDLLKKAQELNKLKVKRKKIIEQETKLKTELVAEMRKEGRNEISFGKEGSIQLFGKFTNKVK